MIQLTLCIKKRRSGLCVRMPTEGRWFDACSEGNIIRSRSVQRERQVWRGYFRFSGRDISISNQTILVRFLLETL